MHWNILHEIMSADDLAPYITRPSTDMVLTHLSLGYIVILKQQSTYMSQIQFLNASCEIAPRWMPQNTFDGKSMLLQVTAWCCQATNHYLSQCWTRFMSLLYMVSLGHNEWIIQRAGFCLPWWRPSMNDLHSLYIYQCEIISNVAQDLWCLMAELGNNKLRNHSTS